MNSSARAGRALLDRPQAKGRPAWRTVNITPAERAGRIAVGVVTVIAGIVLLASAGPGTGGGTGGTAGRDWA